MPLAIDTLNIYSRLKATGLSEDSAKEIAEVFREMIEENLAGKNDLKTTESNLTKYIESVRADLKKDIEFIRADLKKDIEIVRKDLRTTESNLTKDLRITESNLTKYIESVRAELKKDIELLRAELRREIAESKVGVIKWVAGMLIAQAAFIVTLIKLL